MVGPGGLEPPTPRLSSVCSNQLSYEPLKSLVSQLPEQSAVFHSATLCQIGGAEETRTPDPLRAKQMLFQLSYDPKRSIKVRFPHRSEERLQNLLSAIN